MKKIISQLSVLAFFCCLLFATPLTAQNIKGFYVNDFKNILGYPEKEKELLSFAADLDFNYLLLYNMGYIHEHLYDLTDARSAQVLANFIQRAKTQYGIVQIGVVGEKAASFSWVEPYQQIFSQNPNAQIDVYNLEFEFWNTNLVESYYCPTYLEEQGFHCNLDGAFRFYLNELEQIKTKSSDGNVLCETYIGNITEDQGFEIGKICDRVLIHYYRKSDVYNNGNSIYQYKPERIKSLVQSGKSIDVLPLFSANKKFMGPWLLDNPIEQAFSTFLMGPDGFAEQEGEWKDLINIEGYQWHNYSFLDQYLNQSPLGGQHLFAEDFYFRKTISGEDGNTDPDPFHMESNPTQLFPNPASNVLQLNGQGKEIVRVEIYKSTGELYDFVEHKDLENQALDVSLWPEGVFLIKTFSQQVDGEEIQQVMIQRE